MTRKIGHGDTYNHKNSNFAQMMAYPKHFVFISLDGMTDPLGQSQVLPYLVGLQKTGYIISIVSCEKSDNYLQNKHVIDAIVDANNITWYHCMYQTGKPFFSPWQNYQALKALTKNVMLQHKTSKLVLHCRSYIPALIGMLFKKHYNTGFIFDMRGFWADERIEGGIWKKSNPIAYMVYLFFKKKETQFLQQADAIISLTQKAKDTVLSWNLGVDEQKMMVIPCCADLQHFSNSNLADDTLAMHRLKYPEFKNHFVLSYIGSLGTWYMAKEMLLFYKALNDLQASYFLVVTKDHPSLILEEAKKMGIDVSKIKVVSANRNEVPYYIKLSSASVFFIRPTFSKQASSPTKMGELLSLGIPLVINAGVGDTEAIVKKYDCGYVLADFTEQDYKEAAKQLLNNKTRYEKNCEVTAQSCFSLEDGIAKYHHVYGLFS